MEPSLIIALGLVSETFRVISFVLESSFQLEPLHFTKYELANIELLFLPVAW